MAISRVFGKLRMFREGAHDPLEQRSQLEQRILHAVIANPMSINELSLFLNLSSIDTLQAMSSLTVDGFVERLLDGRFAPTKELLQASSTIMHNTT